MRRMLVFAMLATVLGTTLSACGSDRGSIEATGNGNLCSGVVRNYGLMMRVATGRSESPEELDDPQRVMQGFLDEFYGGEFASSVPEKVRADAKLVAAGADDAADGKITDERLEGYLLAFDRMKKAAASRCQDA